MSPGKTSYSVAEWAAYEASELFGPRPPSTERGALVNDDRPKKSFQKLPDNYEQLSEEDRKQWTADAAAAIVKSLKERDSKPKQG